MNHLLWIFLLLSVLNAEALECWSCENVHSNEECIAKGRMKQCRKNQQMCETVVRREGTTNTIFKRCKEEHACVNNNIQNPRAAVPTQCNTVFQTSVCRCCCKDPFICKETLNCLAKNQEDPCTPVILNRNVVMDCKDKSSEVSRDLSMPFGTICNFSCEKGYLLIGRRRSVCGFYSNKQKERPIFDNLSPRCKRTHCLPLPQLRNGKIDCTNDFYAASVCKFVCNEGYDLKGIKETRCSGVTTKWSRLPIPECQEAPHCEPKHTYIRHGTISCTRKNYIGSVCSFECGDSYLLRGDETTTCNRDAISESGGVWTNPPPSCIPINCTPLNNPSNGGVICTKEVIVGSVCTFSCDPNYYLRKSDSSISLTSSTRCVRTPTSNTNARGAWDPPSPPTCQPITCNRNIQLKNGVVTYPTGALTIGKIATLACNAGYKFSINRTDVTCSHSSSSQSNGIGEWLPSPLPVCKIMDCPPLRRLEHGRITCSDNYAVGSRCTYSCNANYYLRKSDSTIALAQTRSCGSSNNVASWDPPTPPTCQPISCPTVSTILNGQRSCEGNRVGNECTYTCNNGYYLTGTGFGPSNNKRTCGTIATSNADGNGIWRPSPAPTCQQITCPVQSRLTNGEISCNGNNPGNECTYSCNSGYFLSGIGFGPSNDKRTCESIATSSTNGKGRWSPSPAPSCRPITCRSILSPPANGQIACNNVNNRLGSECAYTCDSGYYLSGTGFGPSNDKTTCRITSSSVSTGLGTWTPTPPAVCPPMTCPDNLAPPANGGINCNGNNTGNECTYTCDTGYFLSGSGFGSSNDKTTCESTATSNVNGIGIWNPKPPAICSQTKCRTVTAPANGAVTCSNGNNVGSECTYTCNSGYFLSGTGFTVSNGKAICGSTLTSLIDGRGKWSPSPPPICQPISCPFLQNPVNGEIQCNGSNINDECTYSCNPGHYLSGSNFGPRNNKTTCESTPTSNSDGRGRWNPAPPASCPPITCDRQTPPENGGISCSGINIGSTCQYACNYGYYLRGNNGRRVAKSNTTQCVTTNTSQIDGKGTWVESPPPTCQPIICNTPITFRNVNRTCTDEFNLDSQCKYKCNPGFKPVSDVGNMTCSEPVNRFTGRGRWVKRLQPICEVITCSFLKTIQNGEAKCPQYHVGLTCEYTCNAGFNLIGQGKFTCLLRPTLNKPYNAEWSTTELPVCSKPCGPEINSQQYNSTYNAAITCSNGSDLESTCTFTCAEGFLTQDGAGKQETTCQSFGGTKPEWSPTITQILPCTLDE